MQLEIKTKHLKGTSFYFEGQCAVEKALQEIFPNAEIREYVYGVDVNDISYSHTRYGVVLFKKDEDRAKESENPEEVIRILDIPELELPVKS